MVADERYFMIYCIVYKRMIHNHEVPGSIPGPATKKI